MKSPIEKWTFVSRFTSYLYKIIGVNFMDEDFKITWKFIIPVYLQVSFVCLLTYTIFYYRKKPFDIIKVAPAVAIFFPVSFDPIVIK